MLPNLPKWDSGSNLPHFVFLSAYFCHSERSEESPASLGHSPKLNLVILTTAKTPRALSGTQSLASSYHSEHSEGSPALSGKNLNLYLAQYPPYLGIGRSDTKPIVLL
jgi:hypothetical protein